jgi:simple sugar transport system ATP-binding protein
VAGPAIYNRLLKDCAVNSGRTPARVQLGSEPHGIDDLSYIGCIHCADQADLSGFDIDLNFNKTHDAIAHREVGFKSDKAVKEERQVRLAVRDLWANSDLGTPALRGVNLELCSGEILGVAGVSGNGQRELAQAINGLRPVTRGSIWLGEKDVTGKSPAEIIALGQSYIPEERMRDGMIREFTVSENLILRENGQKPFSRFGFLNFRAISRNSAQLIESFNVKTPSQETPVKNLSGGNIQKLLLARELSRKPRVLIAAQPTRGLDIGATEYVHKRLLEQRAEGTAILLISEDLDEILALSDRIIVIYEGEIMGEVMTQQATPESLGLLMAGVRAGGGDKPQ